MNPRDPSFLSSEILTYESVLNRITSRIRQSLELQEILTTTAREIRAFLNLDRVKIYCFHTDGSGEVIAEAIDQQRLPSLLGLRFPATDVPPHARDLFVKARQRVIVNVPAQVKAVDQPEDPEAKEGLVADIRYSLLDPCHGEYLTTMGVAASLTLPILHQQKLWGLLACHHSQSRQFSERELNVVQLLVDQVSIAIAQANLLQQTRYQVAQEATLNRISSLLHTPIDLANIRQRVLEEIVKALQGSGGRLYIAGKFSNQPAQVYTYGEQPHTFLIEESNFWQHLMGLPVAQPLTLQDWPESDKLLWESSLLAGKSEITVGLDAIAMAGTERPAFATEEPIREAVPQLHAISDLYQELKFQPLVSAFIDTAIRSVLIVPIQYRYQCVGCLSIFRNQIETETLWAGYQDPDQRNFRPRQSFSAWREIKQGQAQPWQPEEMKLAQALGTHLYMAVMQRHVEDLIRHQASHDALTGLPNRLLFNDNLTLALAQAHRRGEILAVLFLDLDRFKTINDTLGHAIGDELLQAAAHRIQNCLAVHDTLARWGGDEFTLLLPHVASSDDVAQISAKILNHLKAPFHLKGHEFHITASIGIALAPYDGEDAETLLKHADTAMYRVKQEGKNSFQFFASGMNHKALEQLVLANSLYKALNRQEFLLHYQPQLNLQTGKIMGIEALVRWQHPEKGLVPPQQFIPLAEETGLIVPLGEWVIETACEQNRAWQLQGFPPMRIAVNISGRQFQQQYLTKSIAQLLATTGLEPQFLEVEITESIAIQDVQFAIKVLRELQEMGIQVSIDDFGTGYSSLATLQHFPLNTLKIDRAFVNNATVSTKGAALVRAIVTLGHGLNLRVIAEGVETHEQLNFLRSIGCDGIQGYFFSRPLPAAEITKLFRLQV